MTKYVTSKNATNKPYLRLEDDILHVPLTKFTLLLIFCKGWHGSPCSETNQKRRELNRVLTALKPNVWPLLINSLFLQHLSNEKARRQNKGTSDTSIINAACLHGGGGPQEGAVTRLGGVMESRSRSLVCPYNLSFWFDHIYMIGAVTRHILPYLPGVPPPCKQALKVIINWSILNLHNRRHWEKQHRVAVKSSNKLCKSTLETQRSR